MLEKPILFSTPMVQAILDGRKTMTRRVVKPRYSNTHLKMRTDKYGTRLVEMQNEEPGVTTIKNADGSTTHTLLAVMDVKQPYHRGDILWVRETWYYEEHMHDLTAGEPDLPSGRYSHRYVYRASSPDYPVNIGVGSQGWKPSIFMPREAARLLLRVTDVRVERLQEITEGDAKAEGYPFQYKTGNPITDFVFLWNALYAKRGCGWDTNPWVWVYTFERVEAPHEH